MKNENKLRYVINLLFFLYFLVLIAERAISVALSLANGVELFGSRFHLYVYLSIFVSFVAFLVFLVWKCRKSMHALFVLKDEVQEANDFKKLSIASGLILLSGMVHSEYTISGIQFASYGFLIVAMLLFVVLNQKEAKNSPLLWLSFVYLVCFSMAIPVSYPALSGDPFWSMVPAILATYVLVAVFTFMLVWHFGKEEDQFRFWWFFLAMVVLDAILIGVRWNDEINWFVLVAASASAIFFLVGWIVKWVQLRKSSH